MLQVVMWPLNEQYAELANHQYFVMFFNRLVHIFSNILPTGHKMQKIGSS